MFWKNNKFMATLLKRFFCFGFFALLFQINRVDFGNDSELKGYSKICGFCNVFFSVEL